MKHRDLWEIYRRWRAGQSLARIAAGARRERKTVRRYLRGFAKLGLDRDGPVVERQRFYEMVTPLLAGSTRRPAPAADQWLRHREELRELINRKKDPLKPKSAGLLTRSRLPYEEFVRTQDQQSFTGSFCSMWHFYGGSTEFVSPDNLKAGVLKPAAPR